MLTYASGACVAFLDPLAGLGVLAMPRSVRDAGGDAYGALLSAS